MAFPPEAPSALKRIATRVFFWIFPFPERRFHALAGAHALRRALRLGGGRMLRAPAVFEDAVIMLLTTNCSWEAARLRHIGRAG